MAEYANSPDGKLEAFELTEEQWEAARSWVGSTPVNYEMWEDDHTRFVLHQPTPDQLKEFQRALTEAG